MTQQLIITYEAIKDNKKAESTLPTKQWVAHSGSDVEVYNTCPKRVEWMIGDQKASAELEAPYGALNNGNYIVKCGSDRRKISRIDFMKGFSSMPADATVTPFEPSDIYWV